MNSKFNVQLVNGIPEVPFPSDIIPLYEWLPSLIDDILIDPLADTVYACWLIDILLVSIIYIVLYILAEREGSRKPKCDP